LIENIIGYKSYWVASCKYWFQWQPKTNSAKKYFHKQRHWIIGFLLTHLLLVLKRSVINFSHHLAGW